MKKARGSGVRVPRRERAAGPSLERSACLNTNTRPRKNYSLRRFHRAFYHEDERALLTHNSSSAS